jgi:hypothetical protein
VLFGGPLSDFGYAVAAQVSQPVHYIEAVLAVMPSLHCCRQEVTNVIR